jgi:hemerythrin-like domain-containing protein
MLSEASAWRVLDAEHASLRRLLAGIVSALEGEAWKHPGPQLKLLRGRIHDYQEFESRTHRPKGVVLLGSMRGRQAEADQLLDVLDHENRHCEQLLAQALERIDALGASGEADADEVTSLLLQHQEAMLQQLEREDTALRAYTAQLLTAEEWSAVASSMSREIQKRKDRR